MSNPALSLESLTSDVGRKARGLMKLPGGWTPDFAVFQPSSAGDRGRGIGSSVGNPIGDLIGRAASVDQLLLVRSDSSDEGDLPGSRRTRVVNPVFSEVLDAVQASVSEVGLGARPIIQLAIQPSVLGLASNDRSLSLMRDRFLVEGLLGPRPLRWLRCDRSQRRSVKSGGLTAVSSDDAIAKLRSVCRWLVLHSSNRLRLEWAWDGRRLWILQVDDMPPAQTEARTAAYLAGDEDVGYWASLDKREPRFPGVKVARAELLRQAGLPVPPLIASEDFEGDTPLARLAASIADLAGARFVVRTDVNPKHAAEGMLLPTSRPATSYAEVLPWADETWQSMQTRGIPEQDWSFLLSELVPARASAWVSARPGSDEVAVDALWGFPDGLLHLSHDSWTIRGGAVITRVIRHKPWCLLIGEEGWELKAVPAPWDWRPPLSKAELLEVAGWARRLVTRLGQPVQLMVLAKVPTPQGPAVLPFFYTTLTSVDPAERPLRQGAVVSLRSLSDLSGLVPTRSRSQIAAVELDVGPSLLRDPEFLQSVGQAVAEKDIPILFHGSLLGHAYHLLRATGARIVVPPGISKRIERRLIVLKRGGGLSRVQEIDEVTWQTVVQRMTQTAAATPALLAQLQRSVAESRRCLLAGSLDKLVMIEEIGGATVPLGNDEPGVVPLFMDERLRLDNCAEPLLLVTVPSFAAVEIAWDNTLAC